MSICLLIYSILGSDLILPTLVYFVRLLSLLSIVCPDGPIGDGGGLLSVGEIGADLPRAKGRGMIVRLLEPKEGRVEGLLFDLHQ